MSHRDAATVEATDAPLVAPAPAKRALPNDVPTLHEMIFALLASLEERDRNQEAMRLRIAALLRRLYGPRSERFDPNQGLLFKGQAADQEATPTPPDEATEPVAEPATEPLKPRRKCRPHGRRRLPENLPRVTQHCELTEVQRTCTTCGHMRHEIGTEKSEHLDYKPASLFVREYIVHKYACPFCSKGQPMPSEPQSPAQQQPPTPTTTTSTQEPVVTTAPSDPESRFAVPSSEPPAAQSSVPAVAPAPVVIAAAKPAMPIAGGLPGPGLLAHLIVSKYVEHLPLHRLEDSYQRQGFFLPRSTLCDWLLACGELLRPLYCLLLSRVLLSRVVHTDDTEVKLRDPLTHLLSTARLWGYLGDSHHPYNVFDFTLNRKRDGPQQVLANYSGYLQADAFSGYDGLYLPDPLTTKARIHEVACNAHARRYFYEARTSDALRSHRALAYYGQLYELERQAKDFTDTQRLQMRQELSVPILNTFHEWIVGEHGEVLPKSPMAQALGYALNHWPALIRYTEAGFLAIDNNVAEREMKRIAIGRKNWLFVGSQKGGQTAAILMSFTSTCHRLGVEPWAYLRDVLTRLPTTPTGQLADLVPDRWQAIERARLSNPSVAPTPTATDPTTHPGSSAS